MEEEAAQPCGARSRVKVVAGAWCDDVPKAVSSLRRPGEVGSRYPQNRSNGRHRLLALLCHSLPQATARTSPFPHSSLEEVSAQALVLLLEGTRPAF